MGENGTDERFSYTLRPASFDDEAGQEILTALGRVAHSFSRAETAMTGMLAASMVHTASPDGTGSYTPVTEPETAFAIMSAITSNRAKQSVIRRVVATHCGEGSDIFNKVKEHLERLDKIAKARNRIAHREIFEIDATGLKKALVWGAPELFDRSLVPDRSQARTNTKRYIDKNKPSAKQIMQIAARLDEWADEARKIARAISVEVLMARSKR
jgi:hypothetical protein